MPVTRSMRGISSLVGTATAASIVKPQLSSTRARRAKHKAVVELDTAEPSEAANVSAINTARVPLPLQQDEGNTFLPAVLTFSFESAKEHLINVDTRFRDVFNKLPCRPFEHLESVDPFRSVHALILKPISLLNFVLKNIDHFNYVRS